MADYTCEHGLTSTVPMGHYVGGGNGTTVNALPAPYCGLRKPPISETGEAPK